MTSASRARHLFRGRYDAEPTLVVRAPGRINLIGDHTDYSGGFVLPMAIDQDLVIAARPRNDALVEVISESQPEDASFSLESLTKGIGWAEYLKGVAAALGADGLSGWDGAVASDIAEGAGLSSSAAIELATALVFVELSGLSWDSTAMAVAGQHAENDWVGMNSGVMDQLICAAGRRDHARLIDCRDLSGTDVPLPAGVSVVLLDTGTRRRLVDSAYNERRTACEEAARRLGVVQLRDATPGDLERSSLSPEMHRRARHVVTENRRTLEAARALTDGDLAAVGRLMNESHVSLRDDFEVSSPALDAMAQAAWPAPGCFGARQTGGGFAGSCVALVASDLVSGFTRHVLDTYAAATDRRGTATICRAADGVSVEREGEQRRW